MSIDPTVLNALAQTLEDLKQGTDMAIPTGTLTALAPLAQPGMRLRIDLAASVAIGAPLVTVRETVDDLDFLAPLTARQNQVARLLIAGQSNKEIARELRISVATVKDHVHAILKTLDLPSRSAVIAKAHQSRAI